MHVLFKYILSIINEQDVSNPTLFRKNLRQILASGIYKNIKNIKNKIKIFRGIHVYSHCNYREVSQIFFLKNCFFRSFPNSSTPKFSCSTHIHKNIIFVSNSVVLTAACLSKRNSLICICMN